MNNDFHFKVSTEDKTYEFDLHTTDTASSSIQSGSMRYSIIPDNEADAKTINMLLQRAREDNPSTVEELSRGLKHLPVVTHVEMTPVSKAHALGTQTILGSKKTSEVSMLSEITRRRLERAGAYIDKLKESSFYSGIILVAVGDIIVRQEAIMPAELEQREFTSETPFNILSIGKLFTTVGIMQLVEKGIIGLDDPINKLLNSDDYTLDGCDAIYDSGKLGKGDLETFMTDDRVNVRHLLTHTAGLVQSPSHSTYDATKLGKEKKYSNLGFQLLARIIKNKNEEGVSFVEYIKEHIMKASGVEDAGSIQYLDSPPERKAQPNQFSNSRPSGSVREIPETHHIPGIDGNGCFWMKSTDLLKFASALAKNKLLSAKSREAMLTPNKNFANRALGFQVEGDGSLEHPRIIGHPGQELGASSGLSIIDIDGDEPITLICLSNLSCGNNDIPDLSQAMLEGGPVKPFQESEEMRKTYLTLKTLSADDGKEIQSIVSSFPSHVIADILIESHVPRPLREFF